jgi:3-dehydroquinate synthase
MLQTIKGTDHPIYFGDVFDQLNSLLKEKEFSSVFILTDNNEAKLCKPLVLEKCPSLKDATIIEVAAGEEHKNLDTCQIIWKKLLEQGADRNALLVTIGGGVVSDMGGFCAATFKRGISFISIPTTLLSQADASIGGKTGIDFLSSKNQIGAFNNPLAIFSFPGFIKTLPQEQIRSGFSEILKQAIIGDENFFKQLQGIENIYSINWDKIIPIAIELKLRVVLADPFEKNVRKILNFGHTIGHAIESYFLEHHRPITHGEAVAAGMIAETYLSVTKKLLDSDSANKIYEIIKKHFLKLPVSEKDIPAIMHFVKLDKKNNKNVVKAVLLDAIGKPHIDVPLDEVELKEGLLFYINKI